MGNFDEVWRRIWRHKGETFIQVRGGGFSYRVEQEAVVPDRTNYSFHRSRFEKAWSRMPVSGPGELQALRGPSYLFAILTDPRISGTA